MKETEKTKRFSSEETASFCDQIAMLLNGGIPLHEGAYILAEEVEDKKTRQVLQRVEELVRENSTLYEALEDTGAFPDYMIHMVKVGETTGKLEEVLRSLAVYYERQANVTAAMKSAVAFPFLLLAMMAVIMLVMVWKIIPMFEGMFLELSTQVADTTRNTMEAGVFAGKLLAGITCGMFAVLLLLLLWYQGAAGKKNIKKLLMIFRPVRRLTEKMAVGQFVSSLALMTASGMDQTEALQLAAEGCSYEEVQRKILHCQELLQQGEDFDEALKHSELITGRENRMIGVAARAGATDEIFAKLGSQYDEKLGTALNSLSGKLETGMVVVLALMVGTILISIMLPLVSMISSIG